MKRFICFSIVLMLQCCPMSDAGQLFAQPVLTRSGSYTYLAPANQSVDAAKKTATELAMLQILEEEYGTVVGVSKLSKVSNTNGESSSSFLSIGQAEVKGEWISTVGKPEYELAFSGENLVVTVKLTGKIRAIVASSIEIDARILRNGADIKYESERFFDGDQIFVYFKSPVKGFAAVYQYDSDGVFRLLPYNGSQMPSVPVKAGKDYLFFDQAVGEGISSYQEAQAKSAVESNYIMTCNASEDLCRYYVIFSPNNFSIANDSAVAENLPATLDFTSFQKWLGKVRAADKDMVVVIRDLTLQKK